MRVHVCECVNAHAYTGPAVRLSALSFVPERKGFMKEKALERMLVRAVKNMGGLALKFVSPGMAGVPDRLVLFPGGSICFVELKAPGEMPRPLQRLRHKQLQDLGFRVYVIDSKEKIGEMVGKMKNADLAL